MQCTFSQLTKGSKCPVCGYELKRDYEKSPYVPCGYKPQYLPRVPEKKYLADTITVVRDDGSRVEQQAWLIAPPCQSLAARTDKQCKKACGSTMFLPVYKCSLFRLCSPYGKNTDPDIIRPCPGCPSYVPREEPNGPAD